MGPAGRGGTGARASARGIASCLREPPTSPGSCGDVACRHTRTQGPMRHRRRGQPSTARGRVFRELAAATVFMLRTRERWLSAGGGRPPASNVAFADEGSAGARMCPLLASGRGRHRAP
jgi:hypothetical protein